MTEEYYEIYEIKKNLCNCDNFNFSNSEIDPIYLSNSMQMTTIKNNGISLAAPNIGLNVRVIYIRGMESAMFNPRIIESGKDESYMEELSIIPGDYPIKIKRPDVIKVRYLDALKNVKNEIFTGITSRAIQKEIDFLYGIDYHSKATKFHRDQAKRKK